MKKLITLGCALILALSLAACGEDSSKGNVGSDIKDGVSRTESAVESGVSGIMEGAESITGQSGMMDTSGAKISRDEAKKKAFEHAGLAEKDVTGLKVDLDRDNGTLKYEVDFHHGGYEYDYDINAETGEIISSEKDKD